MASFISESQFGFMRGHSSLQQLLILMDSIQSNLDSKTQVDVIYMDFRKAFDSVAHVELLLKLWNISFMGKLWLWFKAYFFDRAQCMGIDGVQSDLLPVISGVPQGSPLMYVNDSLVVFNYSYVH